MTVSLDAQSICWSFQCLNLVRIHTQIIDTQQSAFYARLVIDENVDLLVRCVKDASIKDRNTIILPQWWKSFTSISRSISLELVLDPLPIESVRLVLCNGEILPRRDLNWSALLKHAPCSANSRLACQIDDAIFHFKVSDCEPTHGIISADSTVIIDDMVSIEPNSIHSQAAEYLVEQIQIILNRQSILPVACQERVICIRGATRIVQSFVINDRRLDLAMLPVPLYDITDEQSLLDWINQLKSTSIVFLYHSVSSRLLKLLLESDHHLILIFDNGKTIPNATIIDMEQWDHPDRILLDQRVQMQLENLQNDGLEREEALRKLQLERRKSMSSANNQIGVLLESNHSWDEIYGYQDIQQQFKDLVYKFAFRSHSSQSDNTMRHSNTTMRLVDRMPLVKGILLHGPTGCGKSAMIAAFIADGRYPVIQIQPSRIISKYFGESEAALRSVFTMARNMKPCIIFIDNIEFLAQRRSLQGESTSAALRSRLLSTLLNEMDGIDESDGDVLVVATTRCIDRLDDAVIRPRRLDHHLFVNLPNDNDRDLISSHVAMKLNYQDVDLYLNQWVQFTSGFSSAQILSWLYSNPDKSFESLLPI